MNNDQPRMEQSPPSVGFGPQRPAFGMSRDRGRRLEIVFALRSGGIVTVYQEVEDDITEEVTERCTAELSAQIKAGADRTFSDSWGSTGPRSWVNLADAAAFFVRPAR